MLKKMTMTIVIEGEGPVYDLVVEHFQILKNQFEAEYNEEGPFGVEGDLKQSATITEEEIERVC
jgi:hypothetical protein